MSEISKYTYGRDYVCCRLLLFINNRELYTGTYGVE